MVRKKNMLDDLRNIDYIQNDYDKRARIGGKIRILGKYEGTILGTHQIGDVDYLIVDFDENVPLLAKYYHPKWRIEYLD